MPFVGHRGPQVPKGLRALYQDFLAFYWRWGLETLADWQLPVPLRAELLRPTLYDVQNLPQAGRVTFLPWYFLRDRGLDLHKFASQKMQMVAPEHLRAWLDGMPKRFGQDRFAQMLQLYVFFELALKHRYATRLQRNKVRIYSAFGSFLFDQARDSTESVKKIVGVLGRRLRAYSPESGSSEDSA